MSTFPQKLDVISHVTADATSAPGDLIGLINEAINAAERHLGFSLITGGDTRVDGSHVTAGPGRRLLPMSGTWHVNGAQEGLYGLYATLSAIIDTQNVINARAVGVMGASPQVPDLLAVVQSPLFTHVRRRRTGKTLGAAPVVSSTGEVLLSVCLPHGASAAVGPASGDFGGPFVAGEILDVFVLLWGGA
jgi:hypothetical protein